MGGEGGNGLESSLRKVSEGSLGKGFNNNMTILIYQITLVYINYIANICCIADVYWNMLESNVTFNCVVHKLALKAAPKTAFQKYSEQ